ncbi:hypothetical protein ACH4KN_06685 [Streptomyces sp. NPDC017546]|uniref:hypothetical protein n=1 Tax=unclassified Streptomyces TaxID=2593676 RepID=UPI002360210D|nr:hypothetical protein [Streptomyces sp. MMBL 11-1]
MNTELFAHPLSFRRAPQARAEQLREAGVDRVRLAYAYHGGRWLLTTSEPAAVVDFAGGRWFTGRTGGGGHASMALPVHGDHATTAAEALVASGVAVTGWLVALHQSAPATTRPELAVRNAFGHPYRHALCPAQPDVVRYARDLVAGTAAQPGVSALELEAFGYLGWQHASAHDKAGAALRPVDRWLLSLCFCPACSARLLEAGVDSAEAAGRTRAAVLAQLHDPRPAGGGIAEDGAAALGQELHDALLAVRADVTARLVRTAAEAAGGLPVSVRATADPYACDGKSTGELSALAAAAGGLTVTNLGGDRAALRRDLLAASRTGTRFAAGWNLGAAQTRGEEELADIARLARTHGANALVLYAYDLAPAHRLDWLRRLPRASAGEDPAPHHSPPHRQTEPAR